MVLIFLTIFRFEATIKAEKHFYNRVKGAEDMKKIVAVILCALLAALGPASLAENPFGDLFENLPGEAEGETPPRGGEGGEDITLEIDGQSVRLAYDASPQYSSIQGGTVQASYYAYGADGKTLYELYITFPETARAGMIITPEYALMTHEESSVVLIASLDGVERYYFSSLMDGSVYPEGSGFSIGIDSVDEENGMIRYAGTLSASLIALDMASGGVAGTLDIPSTPFRFTISGQLSGPVPDAPQATREPEDLRKV